MVSQLKIFRSQHQRKLWTAVSMFAICYVVVLMIGFPLSLFLRPGCSAAGCVGGQVSGAAELLRRWGGFSERPMDNKCYRQERTAMLLSVLLGPLGIDQWYAHHWILATFKTLSLGLSGILATSQTLSLGFSGIWALVDVILWTVGGVYGTPGCPGGSAKGWPY